MSLGNAKAPGCESECDGSRARPPRRRSPFAHGSAFAFLVAAACITACEPDETEPPPLEAEPGEAMSGGETTVFDVTREAFARPAKNLDADGREEFALGDHFFNRNWVTAPASAEGTDGLGPLYNATSCSACHFKDGRGQPPEPGEPFRDVLFRLSIPGVNAHGGPLAEPSYGDQLQNLAILGLEAEGEPVVEWEPVVVEYLDGETVELRAPRYSFENLAFGPFAEGTMVSPRVARQLVGLGLLAAIDEETILSHADPDDEDGDGISGKPNWVWDDEAQEERLGRFGWKAAEPTIKQQNARAFLEDIGITTTLYGVQACTSVEIDCQEAVDGGEPEVDESKLDRITFYMHTIAVPGRRDVDDPEVLRGRELFKQAGCTSCHIPTAKTGTLDGYPALSNQSIRPYSDMLLHDMGENLADGRPDHDADEREWRTAPLWGIGLVETVNKHQYFLHDGRARGFEEAILWHGGEAFSAREAFRGMEADDRAALVRFLQSL
ncbi:MAG: c-type cytochrome [Polyangiaceae bacterium]|nr:c-type cytochrome [Polyangiaceae bacterium]